MSFNAGLALFSAVAWVATFVAILFCVLAGELLAALVQRRRPSSRAAWSQFLAVLREWDVVLLAVTVAGWLGAYGYAA